MDQCPSGGKVTGWAVDNCLSPGEVGGNGGSLLVWGKGERPWIAVSRGKVYGTFWITV